MKNKSVKLPFVTKNSKHLVGTSGDDLSALIEFTPCFSQGVNSIRGHESSVLVFRTCFRGDETI